MTLGEHHVIILLVLPTHNYTTMALGFFSSIISFVYKRDEGIEGYDLIGPKHE